MSVNKVILVGNVGKDPVIRYFDKGVAKAAFPLATSETYTNQQGETITSTEWHNIVLWRALAEVAEKTVKKGSQVYIVGKIKTRSYVDKDGNNKYITEILADILMVLDKKQSQTGYTAKADAGKVDMSGKEPSASEISEPGTPYQPTNDNGDKSWPVKGNINSDDFGQGGTNGVGQGTGQNEDDLPF
jgi:single-strand DNA-binding protein